MLGLKAKLVLTHHHTYRIVHLGNVLLLNSNNSQLTSAEESSVRYLGIFSTQHSRVQSNQINCTVPKEGFVFLSELWIMSPAAELGIYP